MAIRRFLAALALFGALTLPATAAQARWVATWTASPVNPLMTSGPFGSASFDDVTLSQVLRISEGGSQLRVRVSNRYGSVPLAIGGLWVAVLDGQSNVVPGSQRPLKFGGQDSAVIPRGADYFSDVVDLPTSDFARLRVDIYLPEPTGPCTCHYTGLDMIAVRGPGNLLGSDATPQSTGEYRAFLSAIEVDSADAIGTIVTLGDSITDGVGSTSGANRRWPDVLAERLQAAGLNYGVANAGLSGNRLLSGGMGDALLARFDADVLSMPNVTHAIVFIGVNDLGQRYNSRPLPEGFPAIDQPQIDADQMITGYRQLIARAHANGIKLIASPIGPYMGAYYWSEEGEAARQAINHWIVNSGEFDAVVRFDTAFADPAEPRQFREGFHSGDHLHGSDAGLRAVGESIDLALFAGD